MTPNIRPVMTLALGLMLAASTARASGPLFEEDRATPADTTQAERRLAEQVIEKVNARYHHFARNAFLKAECTAEKEGQSIGTMAIQWFTPGKLAISFERASTTPPEDGVLEDFVRVALTESLLQGELAGLSLTARLEDRGFTMNLGAGGELVVPPRSYVVTAEDPVPAVQSQFFIISEKHELLFKVIRYAPGGKGELVGLRTVPAGDECYVQGLQWRTWDGPKSRVVDIEYTYFKQGGTPFVRRLEIASGESEQTRSMSETRSARWKVTTTRLTIEPRGDGAPATTTPADVAVAVMNAYRARDLSALARHATAQNRALLEELARQGAQHPRYQSLFEEGWRQDAIVQWDGKTGEVRYPTSSEAWVSVGKEGEEGRPVVVLRLDDNAWRFEDLKMTR